MGFFSTAHYFRKVYLHLNWNYQHFRLFINFKLIFICYHSFISIFSLYLFSISPTLWRTKKFILSLFGSLVPSLFMNIYITGLNQLSDIEIDKINKPYLPLASDRLSYKNGVIIVLVSLLLSFVTCSRALWPLQVLDTIYITY